MRKLAVLALAATLSLGVLAGCGGGSGKTTQLTVEMGEGNNWVFKPAQIEVNKGDKVEVTLINKDTATAHTFVIPDLNAKSGNVDPGQTTKFTFTASKVGEFDLVCDVPGHKEAGMVGKIIVKD